MAKRKAPGWAGFPEGAALSLALYIVFQCLLALLTIKGAVPEEAAFRFQAGSGAVAAFFGGMLAIRHTNAGTLLAALGSAAIFALTLMLGGMLACNGVVWSREVGAEKGGNSTPLRPGERRRGRKPETDQEFTPLCSRPPALVRVRNGAALVIFTKFLI